MFGRFLQKVSPSWSHWGLLPLIAFKWSVQRKVSPSWSQHCAVPTFIFSSLKPMSELLVAYIIRPVDRDERVLYHVCADAYICVVPCVFAIFWSMGLGTGREFSAGSTHATSWLFCVVWPLGQGTRRESPAGSTHATQGSIDLNGLGVSIPGTHSLLRVLFAPFLCIQCALRKYSVVS
jgi:hypothetical protein